MTAIAKYAGDRVFANKRTFWVKTLTEAAPTALEIKAGTSVELSMFLYADGTGRGGADVGRADSPRRLGSSQTNEYFSTVKRTYGDLLYSEKFQLDDTDPANKARATLLAWEEGYIVEFPGLSPEDPDASDGPAAGDKGRWYKAQLGPQIDDQTGDAEGDEFGIRQPVSVFGEPIRFVLV